MSRVLIGYATRGGATRVVAELIAESLRENGCDVAVADLKQAPDVAGFDAFVVGSGIHAGQ